MAQSKMRGWHYWRNLLGFFGIALIVAASGVSIVFGLQDTYDLLHPRHEICTEIPADSALSLEDVAFATDDGLTLRGWYVPSQNGAAIVALHGRGGSRCGMLGISRVLAEHGYGVLLFDLRAHSASDGELYSHGWRDGVAAAAFLHSQQGIELPRIGAIGFSLGGNVAIQAAARTPDIAAVVGDGAGPYTLDDMPGRNTLLDWLSLPGQIASIAAIQTQPGEYDMLSMGKALEAIHPRPVQLITGDAEGSISTDFEKRVNEQMASCVSDSVSLWIAPGAGHVGAYGLYPDEYEQRVIGFFDAQLLK
jgi:dienelactone hydrolase